MAWDRYAYVKNNPINGTDPSGHKTTECGQNANECGGERKTTRGTGELRKQKNPSSLIPTGTYTSVTFTGGFIDGSAGGYDSACSIKTDTCMNFWSNKRVRPGSQGLADDYNPMITPQGDVSFTTGLLWGTAMEKDGPGGYSGYASIAGVSIGLTPVLSITVEGFSSIDQKTGKKTNDLFGLGIGVSFGLSIPPMGSYYAYVTKATQDGEPYPAVHPDYHHPIIY